MASSLEKQLTSTFQHQNATILPSCLKPLKHFDEGRHHRKPHTRMQVHTPDQKNENQHRENNRRSRTKGTQQDQSRSGVQLDLQGWTEGSGCAMRLPRKTYAAECWGHHLKGRHPQRWWTTNKLNSCETAGAWHRRWLINETPVQVSSHRRPS